MSPASADRSATTSDDLLHDNNDYLYVVMINVMEGTASVVSFCLLVYGVRLL